MKTDILSRSGGQDAKREVEKGRIELVVGDQPEAGLSFN